MEIHTNYITIIHSKSIRNCSKGIKFFIRIKNRFYYVVLQTLKKQI